MNRRRIIRWILVLLWCGLIFYQSSKPAYASAAESSSITQALNSFISFLAGRDVVVFTDNFIRKTAHFIEYLILGLLLSGCFSGRHRFRAIMYVFLTGGFYAVTDEIHQYFVPGRAMRLSDVLIDCAGVLAGALIALKGSGRVERIRI